MRSLAFRLTTCAGFTLAAVAAALVLGVVGHIREDDAEALGRMGFDTMYVLRYPPNPFADKASFGGVNLAAYDSSTGTFPGVGDPRRDGFGLGPRVVAQSLEQQ